MSNLERNIESLKAHLNGNVITPNDSQYEALRITYAVTDAMPAVIIQTDNNQDVAAGIRFAVDNNLQLSVRSGKHSAAGFSTNNGGVVLDLSRLNSIEILDEQTGIVRLGTGALWGDVATKLDEYHLAISSGDTKSVGVGGLTLGGGIGWMVRKYGYAIDSLIAAEVVLADGTTVQANETENSELLWALKGGGGNFGVVTTFTFRAHHLPGKITTSTLMYEADDLAKIITGWRDYMRSAPDALTSFMTLMPSFGPTPPAVMIVSCYADDVASTANAALAPLQKLGDLRSENTAVKPYSEMLQEAHPPQGLTAIAKNMFAKVLSDELIQVISDVACKPGSPIVQLRMMQGAIDDIDAQATALAHRDNEAFLFAGFMVPPAASQELITQSLHNWERLAIYSSGIYSNFISTNTTEDVMGIYPKATYERLAKVKQQYDPKNIFNHNFNIIPAQHLEENR